MSTQPVLSPEVTTYADTHTTSPRSRPADARGHEAVALRVFEVMVAGVALVLLAPLMLLIAVAVRAVSRGPVIYVSHRVGRDRRPFRFYKFRTMYSDSPQRFPELYQYNFGELEFQKIKFKIDNDPRIIPFGKFLRATSLDELPNLWSVVKGDMALVGPRPEVPAMMRYYHGEMLEKFSVRPGITGLAQVSGRGDLLFHQTVACDLEYVRTRSFALDLKILSRTFGAVLSRRGAV